MFARRDSRARLQTHGVRAGRDGRAAREAGPVLLTTRSVFAGGSQGRQAAMESSASAGDAWPRPAVGPVRLADALGWGSSVLGAPMTFAPRRFLRAIGVQEDSKTVAWTLGVGVREHIATLTVIANRQRRIGMWSRVAGDTMDAALLLAAYKHKCADPGRLNIALGLVGGIFAADLYTAVALTRAEGGDISDGSGSTGVGVDHDTGGGPTRVKIAVTIRLPQDEVRKAFRQFEWSAFDPATLEAVGDVRFTKAPGERGTEVHIDHEPPAPGGSIGATAAKLLGQSPDQKINDELRRFKAFVETGVIPRSETSPEGASSARQIMHKRQPAQPIGDNA